MRCNLLRVPNLEVMLTANSDTVASLNPVFFHCVLTASLASHKMQSTNASSCPLDTHEQPLMNGRPQVPPSSNALQNAPQPSPIGYVRTT